MLPAGGYLKGFRANLHKGQRETSGSCGMHHGGDDDEDEVDDRSRKRAKRTSGGGGERRAYIREATHGQNGIPDLKVVGQLYNKLSNDEMARLQVLSNITRELDRRGEVAALAELRLDDDDTFVQISHHFECFQVSFPSFHVRFKSMALRHQVCLVRLRIGTCTSALHVPSVPNAACLRRL